MADQQSSVASAREQRREKIKAHTAEAQGERRLRQQAADRESLQAQRSLEYGVLLTAVGGLAVRFREEGFEFVEDYALRLDDVEAIFAPTDSSNEHIRVLFQPLHGVHFARGVATEAPLDLEISEGSLVWRAQGLSADKRLFSSFEVASDILLKLTDLSEHAVERVPNG